MSQNIKYAKNLQLSGDTEKDSSTASSFSVEFEFLLTLEAVLTGVLSAIVVPVFNEDRMIWYPNNLFHFTNSREKKVVFFYILS